MQFKNLLSGCAVGLSLLVSAAHADPTCVATSGSIDPPTIVFSGGAWQISFTATGSANSTVLVTAASNEPIAFVQATTNSSGSFRTNLTVTAPSVASVAKVGGSGEFWVTGITTSGNIGVVTATRIDALTSTAGSITGAVTATTNIGIISAADDISGDLTAALIDQVTAGDDISGDVTSTSTAGGISEDGIHLLLSSGGDISGDITSHRRIGTISASSGIVGVPGSPPTPISIIMSSSGGLGDIVAKSVYATIDLNSGGGELNSLVTTGTGAGGFTGDFVGSLNCLKIAGAGYTYGLNVTGDLNADIDHDANVMVTHFKIGGSLASGADILLPTAGLTKQIIFGANGTSETWTGAVKVNGTAISHDSDGIYTNTPSSLGGGAVGLATFDFHPEGCIPPNNSTLYDSYFDPGWTGEGDPPCTHNFHGPYIMHFGPVTGHDPSGYTDPYTVEHRTAGTTDSFVPVSFAYQTSDVTHNGVYRAQRILRTDGDGLWPVGREYRITVNQNGGDIAIQCRNDVTGQPYVPVYTYSFLLLEGCGGDMDMLYDQNGDNSLTAEDLEAWPGDNPDVSADNEVTAFDLYKLLCGWAQRQNLP